MTTMTADPDDLAATTLAGIRGLIAARDDLGARIDWAKPPRPR